MEIEIQMLFLYVEVVQNENFTIKLLINLRQFRINDVGNIRKCLFYNGIVNIMRVCNVAKNKRLIYF